jgi:hypothetical protein
MARDTARHWLLLIILLLLAGCSGGTVPDAIQSERSGPDAVDLTLLHSLPPLPADRAASATEVTELAGEDTFERSANAVTVDSALKLLSSSSKPSWGIWHFNPPLRFVTSVELVVDIPTEEQAWVAVSDFEQGNWEIAGALIESQTIVLDEARHRSAAGDLYVAAISCNGDVPVVHKLLLTSDDGWTIVTVDDALLTGSHCCLAVVGGHPAISYYDGNHRDLKYAYATTVTGSEAADWVTTFVDSGSAEVGRYSSLVLVQSQPAISYYDETNGALRYARRVPTIPPSEPIWTRIIVDAGEDEADVGYCSSLAVVDGRPLISYQDYTNNDLKYAVSLTPNGTAPEDWVDYHLGEGGNSWSCSLAEVDGTGAVAWFSRPWYSLAYKWFGSPVAILLPVIGDAVDPPISLAVVDGSPAIACYSDLQPGLVYTRSDTPRGTAFEDWLLSSVDSRVQAGLDVSLAVVDGRPAIAYRLGDAMSNAVLMFAWSDGPTGTSPDTWETIKVDGDESSRTGYFASLAEVDGKPAICYYDVAGAGGLKYAIRLGP